MELIMMCGLPTSGKSTYVKNLPSYYSSIILSTDDYIEEEAKRQNLTYNQIFEQTIDDATKELELQLQYAIEYQKSVIYDQTNLTVKTRKKKLSRFPDSYKKTAVYSVIALEEALKRNRNREGKFIPESVLKRMYQQFTVPTLEEGFDYVIQY